MAGDLDATLAVVQGFSQQPAARRAGTALSRRCSRHATAQMASSMACSKIRAAAAFDPATLKCAPGQAPGSCLTTAQVEAARRVYGGLKDPTTGAQLYPGLAPGSEPFWPNRDLANPFPIPIAHYKWLVFADPNWDWRTFDSRDPAGYQAFRKGESSVCADSQCHQPGSRRVPAARWKAAAVSRLERPADRCRKTASTTTRACCRCSERSAGSNRGAERRAELLPAVHGAGDGALRRRTRPE